MGLKWNRDEDTGALDTLDSNLDVVKEFTDDIKTRLQDVVDVIDGGELTGSSYNAAKSVFETYYLPIAKSLNNLTNDIRADRKTYESARGVMAGIDQIDEDTVNDSIKSLNNAITQASNSLGAGSSTSDSIAVGKAVRKYGDQVAKLQGKLQDLHDFNSKTSNLFSDYGAVFQDIMSGIEYINGGDLSANGDFTPGNGASTKWLGALKQFNKSKGSKKTADIMAMMNAYDLDYTTAKQVHELQVKLQEYAKKNNLGTSYVNYTFAQIIGSVSYGNDKKWKISGGLIGSESLKLLLEEIGFSHDKAKKLTDKLKANHTRTSDINNDFVHSMAALSVMMNPNPATNAALLFGTKQENKGISFYSQDFVNAMVTYRGDIVSGGISKTDLNADITALNLFNSVKKGNTLIDSTKSYAKKISDGGNGAAILAKRMGNGDIKIGTKMFDEELMSEVNDPVDGIIQQSSENQSTRDDAMQMKEWFNDEAGD